jgi:hypothetical protein
VPLGLDDCTALQTALETVFEHIISLNEEVCCSAVERETRLILIIVVLVFYSLLILPRKLTSCKRATQLGKPIPVVKSFVIHEMSREALVSRLAFGVASGG